MALREVLASFGFEVDARGLIAANVAVDTFVQSLTGVEGVAAGAFSALNLLKGGADSLAQQSEELYKASTKSGLGFVEFQRLAFVSGISAEKLTTIFRKLQQTTAAAGGKAGDATHGFEDLDAGIGRVLSQKEAGSIFKSLGLTASEDVGENFDAIVHKLAGMTNVSERTALAMKIFGRSGADIIPFLEKSPEEIDQMSDAFKAFGGITDEERVSLRKYQNETKAFDLGIQRLKTEGLMTIIPALTAVFSGIVNMMKAESKAIDNTALLKVAVSVLGIAFLLLKGKAIASAVASGAAWLIANAPLVLMALAIAVVIALFDDLVHFIKGDADSAISQFLDLILGEGSGDTIAAKMRDDLGKLVDDIHNANGVVDTLKAIFGDIFGGLYDFFATSIPELWTFFWSDMNRAMTSGGSGFGDAIAEVVERAGLQMWKALQTVINGALSAVGLSTGHSKLDNFITGADAMMNAKHAAAQQQNDLRAGDLAMPVNRIIGSQGFAVQNGVMHEDISKELASSPRLPGSIVEVKPTNTVAQNNVTTVNVYGAPAEVGSEIGRTVRGAQEGANNHIMDALNHTAQ